MPRLVLIAALASAFIATVVLAQPRPGAREKAARAYFTDVRLTDHTGKTRRLFTDLMKNKTVVVVYGFHTESEAAKRVTLKMARVQKLLGPRAANVNVLAIALDPERAPPSRLKTYAARLGVRGNWWLLSGARREVGFAIRKFGLFQLTRRNTPEGCKSKRLSQKARESCSRRAHRPLLRIGNLKTGLWKKVHTYSSPTTLAKIIRGVLDDKEMPRARRTIRRKR